MTGSMEIEPASPRNSSEWHYTARSGYNSPYGTEQLAAVEPVESQDGLLPRTAIRSFQILKNPIHPIVLSFPPNISFDILPNDDTVIHTSPYYHTSILPAIKHKLFLPPTFSVFAGIAPHLHTVTSHSSSLHRRFSNNNRNSDNFETEPWSQGPEVAKLSFKGGMHHLEIEILMLPSGEHVPGTPCRRITLKRKGWGRKYTWGTSEDELLFWRGDSHQEAEETGQGEADHDTPREDQHHHHGKYENDPEHKAEHGNLVLAPIDDPTTILARWENAIDAQVLGNLFLFRDFQEGQGLEEVVLGCLAIVLAERVRFKGWFLWEGKGYGDMEREKEIVRA